MIVVFLWFSVKFIKILYFWKLEINSTIEIVGGQKYLKMPKNV